MAECGAAQLRHSQVGTGLAARQPFQLLMISQSPKDGGVQERMQQPADDGDRRVEDAGSRLLDLGGLFYARQGGTHHRLVECSIG